MYKSLIFVSDLHFFSLTADLQVGWLGGLKELGNLRRILRLSGGAEPVHALPAQVQLNTTIGQWLVRKVPDGWRTCESKSARRLGLGRIMLAGICITIPIPLDIGAARRNRALL